MNQKSVKTSLTNTNQDRAASEAGLRALPSWPREVEGWRRVLSECEQKPTRKRIHALRVATLRLQAQFVRWLDEQGDHPAMQAVKQWSKQAKHLRRALGSVRNCDIYAAKLAGVRSTLTTPAGYEPRTSRTSLRQIGELEGRIQAQSARFGREAARVFRGAAKDRSGSPGDRVYCFSRVCRWFSRSTSRPSRACAAKRSRGSRLSTPKIFTICANGSRPSAIFPN